MILVIDFNGYLNLENEFTIKEYSFYTMDLQGNIRRNEFNVISPEIEDLNELGRKSKKNYEIYYQKYGIKWTTGTITKQEGDTDMIYNIGKSEIVFLADEEKKNHFISYTNLHKAFKTKLVSLESLGHKIKFRNSTNCHYHQSPSSNNCANDNVLEMVKFVEVQKLYNTNTRVNLYSIIDFNCYKYENHSLFKEVAISRISIDGVMTSHDLFVEKPPDAQFSGPSGYEEYYRRYGIKWKAGNKIIRSIKCNLAYNLNRSIRTFVKNKTQKKILSRLGDQDLSYKIICLDELGYDVGHTELGFTKCKWHDNKKVNNCADDNVRLMTNWLLRKNLLNLEISGHLKSKKLKGKAPTIVVDTGVVYQDIDDPKARYHQAQGSREFPSVATAAAASASDVSKRKIDKSLMPSASRYYNAFASMVSSSDGNERHKIKNLDENTRKIDKSHDTVALNVPLSAPIRGSHAISPVKKAAVSSTATANKRKFDNSVVPSASRYYEAFPSTMSPTGQKKTSQEYEDDDVFDMASELGIEIKDDNDDDDVFDMASELGIEIKDDNDDDDVFDMASELGIEVTDDNGRLMNETMAPNMSQYYQAHGSNDFRINKTEKQTDYDDDSAINTALELESQMGKHTPKNIADLNPESLFKHPIDDLHNYSFSSNEFNDLLDDDNDNNHSKIDVNQRHDRIDDKLLSSSVFNDPTNLFDDDDDDDEFNNFVNIDALLHSEALSDRREDNDDQENEIFDEKLLDTYIVNNPNNISFDEDEFYDILGQEKF